jgi:hypothetical protein
LEKVAANNIFYRFFVTQNHRITALLAENLSYCIFLVELGQKWLSWAKIGWELEAKCRKEP